MSSQNAASEAADRSRPELAAFTLTAFDSLTNPANGRGPGDVTLDGLAAELRKPRTFPVVDLGKKGPKHEKPAALGGFSLSVFRDNYRDGEHFLYSSGVGLDIDGNKSIEEVTEALEREGIAAIGCTTFNHRVAGTDCFRFYVPLSRQVDAEEHAVLWEHLDKVVGGGTDPAGRDASRFWYGPGYPADRAGDFRILRVEGSAPDVDAVLAASPVASVPEVTAPTTEPGARPDLTVQAALALARAWPERGRNDAQLKLAGGLLHDAIRDVPDYIDTARRTREKTEALAKARQPTIDFLCDVCREAGDEDRPKRTKTVDSTIAKLIAGAEVTGWPKLADVIGVGPVEAAKRLLRANDTDAQLGIARGLSRAAGNDNARAGHVAAPKGDLEIKWAGWDAPMLPIPYVVDRMLPQGAVGLLVAHGGSLKTWTALSLALAVQDGAAWLGRFPVKKGRALLLDYEADEHEAVRRMRILKHGNPQGFGYARPDIGLHDPELWGKLPRDLALVIVDSLAAGSPGTDENDVSAALPLNLAHHYAAETGAAVLFIHHAKKGDGDKREMVRGSTAIFAAADVVYSFKTPEALGGGKVRTKLTNTKSRRGKAPPPLDLELSDEHGLRLVPEDEREALPPGTKTDTDEGLRRYILLKLSSGPSHVEELAKGIGVRKKRVTEAIAYLKSSGEIVVIDRSLHANGPKDREKRVLAEIDKNPTDRALPRSTLAKRAHVTAAEIEAMEQRHIVQAGTVCGEVTYMRPVV